MTNFSANRLILVLCLLSLSGFGCAGAPVKTKGPPLKVISLSPDQSAPQAAEMATIRWKSEASGGVGKYEFEFRIHDGKAEKSVQSGPSPVWDWKPLEPGTYRVKVVLRDSIGNTADSGWTPRYVIVPKLVLRSDPPDKSSPQAAEMATVHWESGAAGGVGKHVFEFLLNDGKVEKSVQSGPSPVWDWKPTEAGTYRVKAVVRDSIGNTVDGGWSPGYVIVPKLVVSSLSPGSPSPQPAMISSIRWSADVKGGVGGRTYAFWILEGKKEKMVQSGLSAFWEWLPRKRGTYRVKSVVRDSLGNTADGGWSADFLIGSPLAEGSLIAVMPAENLTGTAVPLKELRKSILETMKSRGINILEEDALEKFMEKHRVRYTGGLNRELGDAFRKETGTKAVLFVSLNQYDDSYPPKIALTARLASTGGKPVILWVDSVDMSGNDAPGILGIGAVHDPRMLWKKAMETILGSMTDFLSARNHGEMQDADEEARVREEDNARFRPKNFYGIPPKPQNGRETISIAVLPFLNDSTRRNAGEIMAHLFVRRLSEDKYIEVIEPGVVRQSLLMSRTIMEGGLSLPQADLLHTMLNVDLVFTGNVNDYKDYSGPWGAPEVDFSTRVFDTRKRQVVWTSNSHNRGDDWVFFFNIGKVNTAHRVASEMAREVVESMVGVDVSGP